MQNDNHLFEVVGAVLRALCDLWIQDQGQDLIEYTLLLGFVALIAVGVMAQAGVGVQGIWRSSNTTLVQANTTTATPTSGHHGGDPGGGHGGHGGHDGR